MDARMASGVQEHLVGGLVAATFASPDQVMGMPSRLRRDQACADRAVTSLFCPEQALPPNASQGCLHGRTQAFLEVQLPGRIVRVGSLLHLHLAANRHAQSRAEPG